MNPRIQSASPQNRPSNLLPFTTSLQALRPSNMPQKMRSHTCGLPIVPERRLCELPPRHYDFPVRCILKSCFSPFGMACVFVCLVCLGAKRRTGDWHKYNCIRSPRFLFLLFFQRDLSSPELTICLFYFTPFFFSLFSLFH